MLNIRRICHRNRGFTLIEIILALAICSMIILPIFSILDFSIDACTIGEDKDELMLNGRYAIEYVKNDVRGADKIISSDKINGLKGNYPTNIGFIIMMDEEDGSYKYITYHTKNQRLVRTAYTSASKKYPTYNDLKGHNDLCEYIYNIENTKFDTENSIISLDFNFEHKNNLKLNLKSDIYIRCPIDY